MDPIHLPVTAQWMGSTSLHPRHQSMDVTVVLEEVQVPPGLFLEVVGRALRTAHRAGVLRPSLATHRQVQFMRMLVGVYMLSTNCQGD